MQRRSKSKSVVKQIQHSETKKSLSKGVRMQEQPASNNKFKQLRQNILISLANVFLENKNDPSLIYPWMKDFKQLQQKIIGRNYIIQGPSQSGKYSSVKYAIDQNHKGIVQILINCDITTTEHQIYQQIIEEFVTKCPKCKFPDKKQLKTFFPPENIDFQKLNPYLQKGNVLFVIIIKNAERLSGYKTQSLLYNLFDWMKSQQISQKGGLVLISRKLRLTDQFQKRVKSRFCGNRLCIFRPDKAQIYIEIIKKRIDAVIKDKQTWLSRMKLQKFFESNQEQIFESEEDQDNTKGKKRGKSSKKVKKNQNHPNIFQVVQKNQNTDYFKSLNEYYKSLAKQFTQEEQKQLGIGNFFIQKTAQLTKLSQQNKNKNIFNEETVLKPQEQIDCLHKIRKVFQIKEEEDNPFLELLQQKLQNNQIITIPFLLMVVQHIFIRLDETLVKMIPVENLRKIIFRLFQRNFEYQFPTHDMEGNTIESKFLLKVDLGDVELIFLVMIYHWAVNLRKTVKLRDIYEFYRDLLHKQINLQNKRSANTLPILIIESAMQNLYRNRIIEYPLHNLWNGEIRLIFAKAKIQKGLQRVVSVRSITQFMKEIFNSAQITGTYKIRSDSKIQ